MYKRQVLQPGAFTSSYVLYGVGITFAVIGIVMLLIAICVFLSILRSRKSVATERSNEPFEFQDDRFNDTEYRNPLSGDDQF